MKTIDRRNFLKKSLLGVGSLVFASSLKAADVLMPQNASQAVQNNTALLALYRQAKEYFYRKEYANAISIFTQLIENNPNTLFLYDGLASVYSAQQNLTASTELYRQAAIQNPQNALFAHRYALSLRNLCLGNMAAAQNFASQHGIDNLYEFAAAQLLAAVVLKPQQKGFKLDLKDFPRLLEKYNANPRNAEHPLLLSENIINRIETASAAVSAKWTVTRASHKPAVPPENSLNSNNGNGKQKRNLHSAKERKEREKAKKKARKQQRYVYLKQNINSKNTNKTEQYGLQILADDIGDTNAVGTLRRYFRKGKHADRIVSLNRYYYTATDNIYAGLALAASIAKYRNDTPSLNEAQQILTTAEQYLGSLTSVAQGAYYITKAKISQKKNKAADARTALLAGVTRFDGRGGVAYTLLEHYTATFDKKADAAKAINIQKALCGRQTAAVNDPIWNYAEKYRAFRNENEINRAEKLKALRALAKLQQTFKDSGYSATIMEIAALQA